MLWWGQWIDGVLGGSYVALHCECLVYGVVYNEMIPLSNDLIQHRGVLFSGFERLILVADVLSHIECDKLLAISIEPNSRNL